MRSGEKWAVGVVLALTLVVAVYAVVRAEMGPIEYQEMSASGYLFRLEDGTGTEMFSVTDAGAVTAAGAVTSGGLTDLNGNCLDLDTDGDTSLCADTDDTIDVEVSGADDFQITANTFTVLAGSSLVNNGALDQNDNIDQDGASDEVQLSVNGYTTQTNDLVQFDGGLTDIGGGSYSVADGDNDLGVAAVLEVDGEFELDGALDADSTANFAGAVTLQALLYPSAADETITDGETLTPTVTIYNLDAAGAVTMTIAASATEGQLLVLCGDSANNITVNDTNIRTNDGSTQVIGQYDCITWVYIDSEWLELSESNNS